MRKNTQVTTETRSPRQGWLSHPAVVALLTVAFMSLATSILIPHISDIVGRQAAKRRVVKIIVQYHANVKPSLNALLTTLELYHKKNIVAPHITDIPEAQRALRAKMEQLYLDFDRSAWFWFDEICEDLKIVGLDERTRNSIEKLFSQDFKKSLVQSTDTLDIFWNKCLDKNYAPSDPNVSALMGRTRQMLDSQTKDRMIIIEQTMRLILD